MKLSKQLLKKYNAPRTLFVLTSFPEKDGEVAVENAVARYSSLLLQNFPENQRVVVLCEKRDSTDQPYELSSHILVVPTYWRGSPFMSIQIANTFSRFNKIVDLMVQFEFSIFGGKIALPGILATLMFARVRNMHISFVFHQVIRDLGALSGHLGIAKAGLQKRFLNWGIGRFYQVVGAISQTIIVHDDMLRQELRGLIPLQKVVVIPHGCGEVSHLSPELRNVTRRELGLKPKDLVVLAYGYLSWYKGTDWIIKNVGEIAQTYPGKRIKLLLPGIQSPTLKGTHAYASYRRSLKRLLALYPKSIVTIGFVPERAVAGVFAASDIVVFPYRVKMSASGALSVAWQYGKRILISREFAKNYDEVDVQSILEGYDVSAGQITFDLTQESLERALFDLLELPGAGYKVARASRAIATARSWKNVAVLYRSVCSSAHAASVEPSYSYA